jgi:hypothetical protein
MQRMPGMALAFFVLGVSTCPVRAWGLDGHRTVGMIADILLANDQTGVAATKLLGGASLSDAATWADCSKGFCGALSKDEKVYVEQNPQHATYHYTDVPIQQSRYQLGAAGTRENDVVHVTEQAVNVLRGRAPNNSPAVLDRKSALWVMAHMVGDLHQPLHVGSIYFADDCAEPVDPNIYAAGQPGFGIGSTVVETKGGNDLKLPNGKSFHVDYWDRGTVTGAMRTRTHAPPSLYTVAEGVGASGARQLRAVVCMLLSPPAGKCYVIRIARRGPVGGACNGVSSLAFSAARWRLGRSLRGRSSRRCLLSASQTVNLRQLLLTSLRRSEKV